MCQRGRLNLLLFSFPKKIKEPFVRVIFSLNLSTSTVLSRPLPENHFERHTINHVFFFVFIT